MAKVTLSKLFSRKSIRKLNSRKGIGGETHTHKIDETAEGYNVVAEIVNILVDENYLAEDGMPDIEKMQLITYEPVYHGYVVLGDSPSQISFTSARASLRMTAVMSVGWYMMLPLNDREVLVFYED